MRKRRVRPARILTEKLTIKTFILGTALPMMAKVTLMTKLRAMAGAAAWAPTRKMRLVAFTRPSTPRKAGKPPRTGKW